MLEVAIIIGILKDIMYSTGQLNTSYSLSLNLGGQFFLVFDLIWGIDSWKVIFHLNGKFPQEKEVFDCET